MTLFDQGYRVARTIAYKTGLKKPEDHDPFLGSASMVPADEQSATEMHKAFYGNRGIAANKWRHYLKIYDRHLSTFRNTKVRFLEIGVSAGGSLQVWRTYLGRDAVLFGVDINPMCAKFDGAAASVRIGSQADPMFLQKVVAEMGGIDVVVDDGSHICSHQRTSFEVLFPLLSEGGVYVCEDTHTSYWRGEFEGGYRSKTSFIEYSKQIIDDLHSEYHRKGTAVEAADKSVHGVHFYNGVVVIDKERQHPSMHIAVE